MKAAIRLFLILITLVVILFAWITHQLNSQRIQLLIAILASATMAVFFILNIIERREAEKQRKQRESRSVSQSGTSDHSVKRSDTSFALKDRKAGLTWGGGNIKASEATRGTKRKFLGK